MNENYAFPDKDRKTWIKNARILDPARGLDSRGDILVSGSRIAAFSPEAARDAEQVIDAEGCLVTPGLIDFHIHLARYMADTGVYPDLMALPNGITAAVDAGSSGTSNYGRFFTHPYPLQRNNHKGVSQCFCNWGYHRTPHGKPRSRIMGYGTHGLSF
jgi:predicted amidohydrolase